MKTGIKIKLLFLTVLTIAIYSCMDSNKRDENTKTPSSTGSPDMDYQHDNNSTRTMDSVNHQANDSVKMR